MMGRKLKKQCARLETPPISVGLERPIMNQLLGVARHTAEFASKNVNWGSKKASENKYEKITSQMRGFRTKERVIGRAAARYRWGNGRRIDGRFARVQTLDGTGDGRDYGDEPSQGRMPNYPANFLLEMVLILVSSYPILRFTHLRVFWAIRAENPQQVSNIGNQLRHLSAYQNNK
jgi:hypothetical protein